MRLVVIGGGFTGITVALNAIRCLPGAVSVTVVEPSARLGRGVPYGTDDPAHRINVPTSRMPIWAAEPDGLTAWAFARGLLPDAASGDGRGEWYIPRAAFGRFMEETLRDALAGAGSRVQFRHVQQRAAGVARDGAGWVVETDGGERIAGDAVALCFGHAAPAPPCPIAPALHGDPRFVPNPWAADALAAIGPRDHVLIAGTGLTMADVVASLEARGHRGAVTAVSRRALLPHSHGGWMQPGADFLAGAAPPRTALGLLRLLRERIASRRAEGWQVVADEFRAALPVLWPALPAGEQRRVVRRLLPFWEVHRFRIAPQIRAAIDRAGAEGRLTVAQAALAGLAPGADGRIAATLRRRGGAVETQPVDAAVLCTGPDRDVLHNPLAQGMLKSGLATLDAVGLGIAVDATSRVLGPDGAWPTLWAFGPMTRGTFGEMTGAPDIAKHIERVAPVCFGAFGAG